MLCRYCDGGGDRMAIRYQSAVAGEAQRKYEAAGARTVDLEKKVFGQDTDSGSISKMAEEVKRYQREVEGISLDQYQGVTRAALAALQGVGIPVTNWCNRLQTRKLERVIGDLEHRRTAYETDVTKHQQQMQRALDIQDAAGLLLQRYQSQLVELQTVLEEKRAEYRSAVAVAKQSDSKAYLALRMDVANLRTDIMSIRQKRDRAAAKVVETDASLKLLSGIQDQLYAVLQKVQDAELKAKRASGQARILDSTDLALPKTVEGICTAAVVGDAVGLRARRGDDAALRVIQAIHTYEVGTEGEEDAERRTQLREAIDEHIDANLDAALRIAESPGNIH